MKLVIDKKSHLPWFHMKDRAKLHKKVLLIFLFQDKNQKKTCSWLYQLQSKIKELNKI
jgi:hypothetical protein